MCTSKWITVNDSETSVGLKRGHIKELWVYKVLSWVGQDQFSEHLIALMTGSTPLSSVHLVSKLNAVKSNHRHGSADAELRILAKRIASCAMIRNMGAMLIDCKLPAEATSSFLWIRQMIVEMLIPNSKEPTWSGASYCTDWARIFFGNLGSSASRD